MKYIVLLWRFFCTASGLPSAHLNPSRYLQMHVSEDGGCSCGLAAERTLAWSVAQQLIWRRQKAAVYASKMVKCADEAARSLRFGRGKVKGGFQTKSPQAKIHACTARCHLVVTQEQPTQYQGLSNIAPAFASNTKIELQVSEFELRRRAVTQLLKKVVVAMFIIWYLWKRMLLVALLNLAAVSFELQSNAPSPGQQR